MTKLSDLPKDFYLEYYRQIGTNYFNKKSVHIPITMKMGIGQQVH
jgi:hypothetical protein